MAQSFRSLVSLLAVGVVCVVGTAAEPIASHRSPFIGAFERFSRNDDTDDSLGGALLISELSCSACHATRDPQLAAKGGVDLTSTGVGLRATWLNRYLADPAATKPGSTMPHMLSGLPTSTREDLASALAAFLSTQRKPFPKIKATGAMPVVHEFWKRGNSRRGTELYHTVGCVACHEPDPEYETSAAKPSAIDQLISQLDPDEVAALGLAGAARRVESVPHGDLAAKYTRRSLTMLLLDPALTRPHARMPSLRLSPSEAADITAHLLPEPGDEIASTASRDQPLIVRGRSLFVQLRCANCHRTIGSGQPIRSKPLEQLDLSAGSSCLENPASGMPSYKLDAQQVAAIKSRLAGSSTTRSSRARQTAATQAVHFRMMQLNCYACHQRDLGASGRIAPGGIGRYRKPYFETVGQVDLGDEGRFPPTLTGVGRKLLPKSLAAVFRAPQLPRRSFLKIRMPAYHLDVVKTLLEGLPTADQADASSAAQFFGDLQDLADEGREIVGTGCVECHTFRGEGLPGVVGVDLAGMTEWVHPRWFYEFVLNPGAVKQRTRMPTFFPDGRSNQPDLLDGDPNRQIAAIWAYLSDLNQQPLPAKIAAARSANYELSPADRPIVLRTFMDGVGTHAIAVGFPAGVHYAFDSEQVRLALGWKGRFLDARGTWFERFTPPAEPLGDSLQSFPTAASFAAIAQGMEPQLPALPNRDSYRFGGYKLDDSGVPTLLYGFQRWQIEDRIESSTGEGLRRTFTIRDTTPDSDPQPVLWFLAHVDRTLKSDGPATMVGNSGLTVSVPTDSDPMGQVRQASGLTQWWFPVTDPVQRPAGQSRWVVEYRW